MGDLSSLKKIESGQEVVRPFSAYNLKRNDTVKSVDKTPFLFRPIPPLSTPYVREKLVGASMAWNQLVQNGNFASASGWTPKNQNIEFTVSNNIATTYANSSGDNYVQQNFSFIPGHKYILRFSGKSNNNTTPGLTIALLFFGSANDNRVYVTSDGNWHEYYSIFSCVSTSINLFRMQNSISGNTHQYKNVIIIDLTLAFSPAIADRIYSMEQAQAGSGIAWIKSYGFLTEDYYANDAGSIQSVCADRKEIVGKNLFNYDSISIGSITFKSTSGTITRYGFRYNLAPGTYTAMCRGSFIQYFYGVINNNDNFVSAIPALSTTGDWNESTFTLSEGDYLILFEGVGGENLPLQDGQLQIELGSSATVYEPYHKTTISLSHDELRGVMRLDANNNLYYDGDEKSADGTITRNYITAEFDGSGDENWSIANTGTDNWYYKISLGANAVQGYIVSNLYPQGDIGNTNTDKGINVITSGEIRIRETTEDTVVNFKTKLASKPLQVVIKLATPTTEQSTPFTSPQYLFDGGTEEFIDYGVEQETRDVAVPVGHVTEYMGASDGTEIKDKFYLPTLPDDDGEYKLTAKIQNGVLAEAKWDDENLIDDTTKVEYKLGINNGLLYIEEV